MQKIRSIKEFVSRRKFPHSACVKRSKRTTRETSRYFIKFTETRACKKKKGRSCRRRVAMKRRPVYPRDMGKQNDGFVTSRERGLGGSFARLTSAGWQTADESHTVNFNEGNALSSASPVPSTELRVVPPMDMVKNPPLSATDSRNEAAFYWNLMTERAQFRRGGKTKKGHRRHWSRLTRSLAPRISTFEPVAANRNR